MPSRPKHPCAYSGCPNLTNRRYCPEHEKLVNSNYEKYDRDRVKKRRYGRAWKRIRDRYAAEHPFCEICYERGVLVPVEEVHHKLPLAEGGTHDRSNLISLCKSCHSRIHAERGDRWNRNCEYTYEGRGVKISAGNLPGERCGGITHKNEKSKGVLTPAGIEVVKNGKGWY